MILVTYKLPRMAHPLQVSIEEFRANLAQFVGRVAYGKERIVVKRYNREAVVVLSADEYDRVANPGRRAQIKDQERAGLRQVYAGLRKMQSIGSKDIKDGSTTIDEVLYGEQGAWRGSGQNED